MAGDRIEKQAELKAPVARVWRAITDYREFGEWFRVKLEGPFEAGKEAKGQVLYPGYEHLVWRAVVQKIEPERLFSFTWHPYAVDPNADYAGETPTLVEFRLEPTASGGTRVTVTESGFGKLPAARRDEAFLRNDGGWTQQMKNIEAHVEARD
ncbi:MAG TPA: SRPBCC family protein [Acidobacteriaceae bacterium]|nr:SRPBCC family protein [Acidobacteriaceae bacterium]